MKKFSLVAILTVFLFVSCGSDSDRKEKDYFLTLSIDGVTLEESHKGEGKIYDDNSFDTSGIKSEIKIDGSSIAINQINQINTGLKYHVLFDRKFDRKEKDILKHTNDDFLVILKETDWSRDISTKKYCLYALGSQYNLEYEFINDKIVLDGEFHFDSAIDKQEFINLNAEKYLVNDIKICEESDY